MLRLLVLLLVLANAGYFAWSQGLLAAWGLAPVATREPQRLQQQIRPEALRILRGNEVRRLDLQPVAHGGADVLLVDGPGLAAQALQPRPRRSTERTVS